MSGTSGIKSRKFFAMTLCTNDCFFRRLSRFHDPIIFYRVRVSRPEMLHVPTNSSLEAVLSIVVVDGRSVRLGVVGRPSRHDGVPADIDFDFDQEGRYTRGGTAVRLCSEEV